MKRQSISRAVLAFCVLTVMWIAIPVDALNVKLYGINYDFRRGPDWDPDRCKPQPVVTRELNLLNAITNRLRIYSLSDCNVRPVLRELKRLNMTVWLGVWVGNKTKTFDAELDTLRDLANEGLLSKDLISGINVGSEVLYRKDVTPEVLIANFKLVKDVLKKNDLIVPMSITDTLAELDNHPQVVNEVDIVTFNNFPFWDNRTINGAVQDMAGAIKKSNVTKSKPFIIGETGWAASGVDKSGKASVASPENAAKFMNDFYIEANKNGWKYYYFAAYDTPYRKIVEKDNNTVEASFGIFNDKDIMNKHYDDLVINSPIMMDGLAEDWKLMKKTAAPVQSAAMLRTITTISVMVAIICVWFV